MQKGQKGVDPVDQETFQTPPQRAPPQRAWPPLEQNQPQRQDTYWERMADAKASPRKRARDGDEAVVAYPVSDMRKTVRAKRDEQSTPWTRSVYADAEQAASPKTTYGDEAVSPKTASPKSTYGDEEAPCQIREMQETVTAKRVKKGLPGTYSIPIEPIHVAPSPDEIRKAAKVAAAEKEIRVKTAVQDLVFYAANTEESTTECEPREGMGIPEAMHVCVFTDCWRRAGKTAIGKACDAVFPNSTAECTASREPTWDVFAKCLTVLGFWQGHLCTTPFPQVEDLHIVIFKYAKQLQQSCSKVTTTMP